MRRVLVLAAVCGLAPALCREASGQPPADPKPADAPAKYDIPYRLTDTKHVLVRAKVNGKGPFNFILDTGAPTIVITKPVAKKAGVEYGAKKEKDKEDKGGPATFASFDLEGGLGLGKTPGVVADVVQLEGMNSMGLAGVELHGVIGYTALARFRVAYDFTADTLVFEELKGFDPPKPERINVEAGDDLQAMGPLVKMLAALSGIKPNFEVAPRGFVGIEFDDAGGAVVVKKVLPGSPAEKAGFKAGDTIEGVKAVTVESGKDLAKALAKAGVGTTLRFTVKRDGKSEELSVELGKGL